MLELLYVSLAVMGAVVVLLGARLVAQRRAAEFTLMRARGAALYQLAWLVLRASVVIAAAAGAAAAVLAIGLTPGDGDAVGWWLAGLTIAVTLAGPVLISVVPQRVAAPATGRAGAPGQPAAGPRPGGSWSRSRWSPRPSAGWSCSGTQGLSSGNSGLYTSAAPVLVAIPVAVVLLRCYPPSPASWPGSRACRAGWSRSSAWPGPPAPRPAPSCRRSPWCWCWPWWRSRTWSALR